MEHQLGSKPHSNGENFSLSSINFSDNSVASIITMNEIIMMIDVIIIFIIIYLVLYTNFVIGSQIYLLYLINIVSV